MNPLQGPTHTLTPSSIHTQNRPKNNGWIYHLLSSVAGYSPKLTAALRFGYPRLSKKIPRTPTKTDSSQGHSSKGQPTPCKTIGMLFHVHLSVTEFWPHIYSLSTAQSSYQTSQIRPNTKMGAAGPVMPKGQLSRVPWPGSCRMLFTFQAVLRPLQQTHKHSCSLHLAIHTHIAHRYIQ